MRSDNARENPPDGGTDGRPATPPANPKRAKTAPTEAERKRIERLRSQAQEARRIVRKITARDKAAFADLNQILLASRLNEALEEIDPSVLRVLIGEKPEQFFRLATAVNAQSTERLRREKLALEFKKHREHVSQQKHKIEQATRTAQKGGLTAEILTQIEEAVSLL